MDVEGAEYTAGAFPPGYRLLSPRLHLSTPSSSYIVVSKNNIGRLFDFLLLSSDAKNFAFLPIPLSRINRKSWCKKEKVRLKVTPTDLAIFRYILETKDL